MGFVGFYDHWLNYNSLNSIAECIWNYFLANTQTIYALFLMTSPPKHLFKSL